MLYLKKIIYMIIYKDNINDNIDFNNIIIYNNNNNRLL